jgi:hypothetical protein
MTPGSLRHLRGLAVGVVLATCFVTGCAHKSVLAVKHESLPEAPQVRVHEDQAWLWLKQQGEDAQSLGAVETELSGEDVRVIPSLEIPFRPKERFFLLDIPPAYVRRGLAGHVFWKDPDGSLHPLAVTSGPPPSAAPLH